MLHDNQSGRCKLGSRSGGDIRTRSGFSLNISIGLGRVAINYSIGDCDSVSGTFGQSEASLAQREFDAIVGRHSVIATVDGRSPTAPTDYFIAIRHDAIRPIIRIRRAA